MPHTTSPYTHASPNRIFCPASSHRCHHHRHPAPPADARRQWPARPLNDFHENISLKRIQPSNSFPRQRPQKMAFLVHAIQSFSSTLLSAQASLAQESHPLIVSIITPISALLFHLIHSCEPLYALFLCFTYEEPYSNILDDDPQLDSTFDFNVEYFCKLNY